MIDKKIKNHTPYLYNIVHIYIYVYIYPWHKKVLMIGLINIFQESTYHGTNQPQGTTVNLYISGLVLSIQMKGRRK